jgi:hypothetical protein
MKQIDGFTVSGNGEITCRPTITSDMLTLEVGGNGAMTIPVNVKDIFVKIGGIGKITLSGTATNTFVTISGSGKVDALGLQTKNCTANISGVGKCEIDVTDSLTSSISGIGTVGYKNKPKYVSGNMEGAGEDDIIGNKKDTTRIKFGDSDFLIIKNDSTKARKKEKAKQTKPIWKGFEIGFNNYFNAQGNTDIPTGYEFMELNTGKSVAVSLNLLQKNIRFGHSNFWFFTGLGITWNNYRFDKNAFLNSNQGMVTGGFDTTSVNNYSKSKLTTSYLTAPVMFELFTSKKYKNAFHIGAGALLGYRLGSHTKQKYESGGNNFKPKSFDDFYLNAFRYGGRIALGYGKFNLFADYYSTSLFREKKGPQLYPAAFGVTLVPF